MKRRVLATLCACALALVGLTQLPAYATVPPPTPDNPATGNSTYFDGLGSPYGGCGLPQSVLESQDFVALNVYDTPGNYDFYPRPVTDASKVGMWDNGRNCGRWVQVRISDYCTGINDGAPGQPFCRNGSWVADEYNDAVLNMLVADSCGDSNAWCRDDPYHLDLAKASLSRFVKNGTTVNLLPNNYNNRRVTWSFIPAPNYSGDIQIGFLQGAQRWWPAIAVSRLPNGIHGVEYFADGAWQQAKMNSDMGQSYIIGGTTSGGTQFQIRIRDASDALLNNGRVYSFSLPESCSGQCSAAYTRVDYTTDDTSTPTTSPTTSPTSTAPTRPTTPTSPTVSPSTSTGTCAASLAVSNSWPGGFQAEVTIRNNGTATSSGWKANFTFPGGQQVSNYWNAQVTQSGAQVSATNAAWNGAIPGGSSTSFGLVVTGENQPVTGLTCTFTPGS